MQSLYDVFLFMNTYYCTEKLTEATVKAELTQFPETALIFYLVIL